MTVQKGSFHAEDDIGKPYVINIFQEVDETPHGPIAGLITLKTADGRHVNRIAKRKYEIVESGTPLHSKDLHAP